MTLHLAEAAANAQPSSALVIGLVVIAMTAIANLAVAGKQLFHGNKGERQIEPTQLASIQQQIRENHHANQAELRAQTQTLNKLDREVGEVKSRVEVVDRNVDGLHTRVGGISRELAATTARVETMERREARA